MVDAGQRLLGIVNLEEIGRIDADARDGVAAGGRRPDARRHRAVVPGDELDLAMELFVENDLLALPIVDNRTDRRVIGMIRRYEIASAYLSYLHEADRKWPKRSGS